MCEQKLKVNRLSAKESGVNKRSSPLPVKWRLIKANLPRGAAKAQIFVTVKTDMWETLQREEKRKKKKAFSPLNTKTCKQGQDLSSCHLLHMYTLTDTHTELC